MVVLNARVNDSARVLTSPAPNAARPGPIGIKVPINPKVGPTRVIISVLCNVFSIFSSSYSTNLRAKASLEFSSKAEELAISVKTFF